MRNKLQYLLGILIIIQTVLMGLLINENIGLKKNCWDKYPHNENQAISQCEGKQ
jgi:hypothetical protein